jgi:hypothetical protein
MDGESERVNQEIEQYLCICGNFQQDDWASLLPIIEFAHNARPHRSTQKSPFEVWYGFNPTFKPPLLLQTRLQSVDEHVQYLEQICKEVIAALYLAAKEMKSGGPKKPSHIFHKDDLVLLEATNLQTTHPKAKLAPRRYGPFKVLWATSTNCKLELPPQMRIHPVFHNSLLKPYVETPAHGPNFTRPPPEIIGGEEGHYEIEEILQERPTRNKKSTQYLVKWKGYPDSENSWLPAKELTHAKDALHKFKSRHTPKEGIRVLQAQGGLKEGILSRATPAPSRIRTSPKKPPLNLSYSQVIKTSSNLQARDPGKYQVIQSPDLSRDPTTSRVSCDQSAHDREKLPSDESLTQSRDRVNFGNAMRPLINTWKTVGKINKDNAINQVIRLTAAQSAVVKLSRFDHPCANKRPALKGSPPVTRSRACPKAVHRPPCISI